MSQINQFRFNDIIRTLTGDAGGAVSPDGAGNIDIPGGTGITVTGVPGTNTLGIAVDGTVATSYQSNAGIAIPALNILNVFGGTNIGTVGVTNNLTINLDDAITLTTVNANTFDTIVAAAGLTISGTSIIADGTDANIDINITSKGSGHVIIDDLNVSGLTAGTLRSSGTGDISSLADGTDGMLLISKTGDVPIWATLTDGNNITSTGGANSISIAVTGATEHAVQIGSAAGALTSLAIGTNGVILQGSTAADPVWSTASYPSTAVQGDLICASAANAFTSLAAGSATYVLTANGAGVVPTWQLPTFGTVTSVSGGDNISTSGTATDPILNLDDDIILTSVKATTFDTNVAAAGVTLSGTSLIADGTDGNIDIILTPKGTGNVQITTLGAGVIGSDATGKLTSAGTTQYALQVGDATSTLDSLGIGLSGQVLQSAGAAAIPAWSTATYPATVNIGDILVASAANTITTIVPTTSGYVLTANGAGSAPTFQANSTKTWSGEAGTPVALVASHGYINQNAGLTTFTLPASAALGTEISICGEGAGLYQVTQAAGQSIQVGNTSTTVGVGGSIVATNRYDSITFICRVADTTWQVLSFVGIFNVI